jgi:hypothetical protein
MGTDRVIRARLDQRELELCIECTKSYVSTAAIANRIMHPDVKPALVVAPKKGSC